MTIATLDYKHSILRDYSVFSENFFLFVCDEQFLCFWLIWTVPPRPPFLSDFIFYRLVLEKKSKRKRVVLQERKRRLNSSHSIKFVDIQSIETKRFLHQIVAVAEDATGNSSDQKWCDQLSCGNLTRIRKPATQHGQDEKGN